MALVIGNQDLVRKTNQRLIIDLVRQEGLISRADLAKSLQLSAPTISANIDRLLKRQVLMEEGSGDSRGGRKPILLKLNPEYGFFAGVDLSSDRLRLALLDFTGEVLCHKAIRTTEFSGEEILNAAIQEINELIRLNQLDQRKLLTVVLATPGVLDRNSKRLHLVPQFAGWEDFPIVEVAEQAFSCPVLIKNDINTATVGEVYAGAGMGYESLAYLSVDTGVGAGIVLKGQLLEGIHGAAGEIGHMIHDPALIRPRKKGLGNLEAVASVPVLLEEAATIIPFSAEDYLSQIQEMKAEIEKGNTALEALMQKLSLTLAYTIVNLHAILDLQTVIIGGTITTFGEPFLQRIKDTVQALAPLPLNIIYSSLAHWSVLKGAFVMAQEHAIENLVNEG